MCSFTFEATARDALSGIEGQEAGLTSGSAGLRLASRNNGCRPPPQPPIAWCGMARRRVKALRPGRSVTFDLVACFAHPGVYVEVNVIQCI